MSCHTSPALYSGLYVPRESIHCLKHRLDQLVDLLSAVAGIAPLDEVDQLIPVPPGRRRELERPEEVVGLLEVRAHCVDLVNE
eukprot:50623-Eustigmatos_ZCMA.PRE.1